MKHSHTCTHNLHDRERQESAVVHSVIKGQI